MSPWVAQISVSFTYLYSIYFIYKVSKAVVRLKRMKNRSQDLSGEKKKKKKQEILKLFYGRKKGVFIKFVLC